MLPIRDDAPRSTTPFVNYFLIALNIAVYFFQSSLGPHSRAAFDMQFAFVPRHLTDWFYGYLPASYAFLPFLSSMFLHGSWLHVLFNMWGLAIFGDNVEDRLGHFPYLLFYLVSGLGASLVHLVFNFSSPVPTLGASGAIAGVMGAYFLLYPGARVLTWWIFFVVWLPAWLVLGYWFLVNLLSGAADSITVPRGVPTGGVAVWAHVGGFLTGLLLIKLLPTQKRYYSFEDY